MVKYGLIGRNISYSFSRGYFTDKFAQLNLPDHSYENFDLKEIGEFPLLLSREKDLGGLNVTIPYKEAIIPFLDELETEAESIGAVNTIQIKSGRLKGFNTDVFGFRKTLEPILQPGMRRALILGTGGASKAVAHVLKALDIGFQYVSRKPSPGQLSYEQLDKALISSHRLIINCTPLGTFPNTGQKAEIPYEALTQGHFLYDLIYNPAKTAFLMEGEKRGALIQNGLRMLELQAEKAWEIWNV